MKMSELIIGYLLEISTGSCSITLEDIEQQDSEELKEILAGLYILNQDLEYREKRYTEAEKALIEAKEFAENANRDKSIFLSRMSHELRTPLNAIIGFSQVLNSHLGPDTLCEYSGLPNLINSAGNHLLSLVNDVLDIVGVEQGKIHIEMQSCHVRQAVEDSINLCQGYLAESEVAILKKDLDIYVNADPLRLTQIMTNLISNAIKYNKKNGTIIIEAKEINAQLVKLSVSDTGVGISNSDCDQLFEPFHRLRYSEKNRIKGSGIGLTLTRYLVEMMGASLGFTSTEGQGSRFYFTLDKAVALTKNNSNTDDEADLNGASPSLKELSILYIEDDSDSRYLMQLALRKFAKIQLFMCETAEEGILVAKREKPDLVFMDLNLPGIDGITAVKQLKQLPECNGARLIALSAGALQEQIDESLAAGFEIYITKPVNYRKIVELIENFAS